MDQYGYGGRPNPYDQRGGGAGAGPPGPGGYGGGLPSRPNYAAGNGPRYDNGPSMGRDDYDGSGNMEMASLAQNAGSFAQGDPNAILNECRSIDEGINSIDRSLEQLKMLQQRALDDADSSASSSTNRQLDALSSETMSMYRQLTDRVRKVKSNPESRQPKFSGQVGRVDRRLKQAIQQYQQVESAYRKKTQDQMARQFRIVRPDASEAEVREAVEDSTGGQVFQQAMMQSNRRGQAQAVLREVQDRHAQLQKIEQQMMELAQLFQDMDTLVMQQDVAIANIEQKGEEVVENIDKGNVEIGQAVVTARKTRKKKWICLGIVVAIILVIVIIVVIYIEVTKGNSGSKKRGLELQGRSLDGNPVPQMLTSRDYEDEKRWVNIDVGYQEPSQKEKKWVDAQGSFEPYDPTPKEKKWVNVDAGFTPDASTASLPGRRKVVLPGHVFVPVPADN